MRTSNNSTEHNKTIAQKTSDILSNYTSSFNLIKVLKLSSKVIYNNFFIVFYTFFFLHLFCIILQHDTKKYLRS